MNPGTAILWPMGALVALTFAVQLQIPLRRFRAGAAKRVAAADFRYGESANVPGEVSIPNRNYINLFEAPVLFYVACLTLYVTAHVDAAAVVLAALWIRFFATL
ncbi:MAG TPA: MAPEG family protein [Usitatibacter sp.]|nr:MAPEG family protein [Usitatibacter sp.]